MREILFRGKDINEKWHYGLLAYIGNYWYTSNTAGVATAFEVIPSTVGQFTGLTDCIGTKIFEGDICEFVLNDFEGVSKLYTKKVEYIKGNFLLVAENQQTDYLFDIIEASGCRIIGNIYDNPELLKECE